MSGQAATIVWFRNDLRLTDNPALAAAVARGGPIVPVFIWCPEEEGRWAPGAASRWWLHQSLIQLAAALDERGSRLALRHGPTHAALAALAQDTGATAVYWNLRSEPAVIARDNDLKKRLTESGFTVQSFNGNLLFEPREIRNSSGQPFRVFTAFWRACLQQRHAEVSKEVPRRLPEPDRWPHSARLVEFGLEPKIDWAGGLRETWTPGEKGATERLRRFGASALADYPTGRDRPDHDGTSRLSPHLHFGEISPGQVWRAILAHKSEQPKACEAYLRQLVWREFAHHLLYHFPQTAEQPLRPEFAEFPWRMRRKWLEAWQRGRTGYPLVDAGMRQLWHTGWMHNRVRLVVASFLVKHLLISWQEGARWFWDTLVDADLANNTLGWQWVAGCGADAAPYFRVFNPSLQARKFDPDEAYVKRWIPEYGTGAYPQPLVEHAEARARALDAFQKVGSRAMARAE
ncbi:MAG TPA: deoxyribodipyrimidine photo-lyase [Rhizomicrobium sp.]|nr:deoxyribodipyrimidine photo-lyase [Rhizomicrobium sp.]